MSSRPVRGTLIRTAKGASNFAYAPYSGCRVGCAVAVQIGGRLRVFSGANLEHSDPRLSICAERLALANAIFHTNARHTSNPVNDDEVRIVAVGLSFPDIPPDAPLTKLMPCDACREWLAEFAPSAILWIDGRPETFHLDKLVPRSSGFADIIRGMLRNEKD